MKKNFLLYLLWYGAGRFFIEGLRTDSLITPVVPLRVSQVVAAAAVVTAAVLLTAFRARTSLSGCGSPAVMELNALVDEVEPGEIVEESGEGGGTSTVLEAPQEPEPAAEGKKTETEDPLPEQKTDLEAPLEEAAREPDPEENEDG